MTLDNKSMQYHIRPNVYITLPGYYILSLYLDNLRPEPAPLSANSFYAALLLVYIHIYISQIIITNRCIWMILAKHILPYL